MELYLIRHGIAQEREPDIKDEKRSLTQIGHQKTRKVAKRLKVLGLRFDLILTSPLVRARQTAEIMLSVGLSSHLEVSSYLTPNGDIQSLIRWLEQQHFSAESKLALVGHQPDLGQWAEIFLWEEAKDALILKKAGIIGLTLPENKAPIGQSQLFWLTPPKYLL